MTASPHALGEFGRIERFFRPLSAGFPGAYALRDDAATIEISAGQELVVTTDAIVAGVHFLPDDPPFDISRKALRVNLSDLAAKGAHPLAYTLTLALGREVDDSWVAAFAAGLAADQAHYGVALIGGDSVSTPGPAWASITAFGSIGRSRMVLRSGARPGDRVFVTGTIGDSALGLAALQGQLELPAADASFLARRYRLPDPRNALAPALCAHASAALDISDGLAADFGHLCRASGVSGSIMFDRLPLSPAAGNALRSRPDLRATIVSGGDDYEILLTAPPSEATALLACAAQVGIDLSEIGTIAAGEGIAVVLDRDGAPMKLEKSGWTHA
jgi:thiamine-monophosphate kinase